MLGTHDWEPSLVAIVYPPCKFCALSILKERQLWAEIMKGMYSVQVVK